MKNELENDEKIVGKKVTVNTLESQSSENEAKMHFTSLQRCSACLNSTSKDIVNLFIVSSSPKQVVRPYTSNFEQGGINVLLCTNNYEYKTEQRLRV
jgi:mannose/fructose/N-acetylgalactosamine-specific phosphotransferase system component IIB